MKINVPVIAGFLLALIAVAALAVIATQQPFPIFKYSTRSDHYISVAQNVGAESSRFMWNNNSLNLLTQAFALFAAAAATLAILRTDEKRKLE
jgi:hypothetical protein